MAGHIPTSKNITWCTPDIIVNAVHKAFEGPPDLDPCSNPHSRMKAKVEYLLPVHDGLMDSWKHEKIWVNPPYGVSHMKNREVISAKDYKDLPEEDKVGWTKSSIADWTRRCVEASAAGSEVLAIIPAATGTKHFHRDVFCNADAIVFLEGRVKFRLVEPPPPCQLSGCNGAPATHVTGKFEVPVCSEHAGPFNKPIVLTEKTGPAPMDCVIVYWGEHLHCLDGFSDLGHILKL